MQICNAMILISKQSKRYLKQYSTVSRGGFALTELVVIIAIIGILIAIVSLNFNSMLKKHQIEKQTADLHGDLSSIRLSAIGTKKKHIAFLNEKNYVFRKYSSTAEDEDTQGTLVSSVNVSYSIQNSVFGAISTNRKIVFNERGLLTGETKKIIIGPSDATPSFNCVVVSEARTNMGKMNGTTCELK